MGIAHPRLTSPSWLRLRLEAWHGLFCYWT